MKRVVRAKPPAVAGTSDAADVGTAGAFLVGQREVTFTETGRAGVRRLVTTILYPADAHGRLPLLLFAPGFHAVRRAVHGPAAQLGSRAVDFPRTGCLAGAAADEADMVHQPADMSYVLTSMLARFPGMLDAREVAAAGQSDGGGPPSRRTPAAPTAGWPRRRCCPGPGGRR